jgi:ribonuclease HI
MSYLRHTITVDFSGDHEREIIGIGIVIQESRQRGRRGPIVDEFSVAVCGVAFGEGEKYAVLRALEMAAKRGFKDLTIRSDYNAMRRRLKKSYREGGSSTEEGLDGRILELAEQFDRVHFGWVPGRKNQRAHHLARRARTLPPEQSEGYAGD